jgi:hypothetical protein
VSGSKKKVDHIFNIINDYSLQGLCALNLNKDNESIIEKKIYYLFDINSMVLLIFLTLLSGKLRKLINSGKAFKSLWFIPLN